MDGKIALEEHWAIDETLNIAGQPIGAGDTRRLLVDFRDRRLTDMDTNGIELAILGLNSPALQAILVPAEAANVAHRANNILADEIAHNPRRFAGFAGLPMQDPEAAARELTRCVTDLGFKGAMVNCFTQRLMPGLSDLFRSAGISAVLGDSGRTRRANLSPSPTDHPVAGQVLRRTSLALQPSLGLRKRDRIAGAAADRFRIVRRISKPANCAWPPRRTHPIRHVAD